MEVLVILYINMGSISVPVLHSVFYTKRLVLLILATAMVFLLLCVIEYIKYFGLLKNSLIGHFGLSG
jgi:hypothetical protein